MREGYFHLGIEERGMKGWGLAVTMKKRCLFCKRSLPFSSSSPLSLCLSLSFSLSLARSLPALRLPSHHLHVLDKSAHKGIYRASIPLITIQLATPTVEPLQMLHGVKSVHLARPDTFMSAARLQLTVTERRGGKKKVCTKNPSAC